MYPRSESAMSDLEDVELPRSGRRRGAATVTQRGHGDLDGDGRPSSERTWTPRLEQSMGDVLLRCATGHVRSLGNTAVGPQIDTRVPVRTAVCHGVVGEESHDPATTGHRHRRTHE